MATFAPEIADFFPFLVPWILGGTPPEATLVNSGNIETPVTITIWGPIVDPVITNATSGKIITLDLEMLVGDLFVITTGKNNITAVYTPAATGIAENGFPYITVTSKFWSLLKGSNYVTFTCTSSTTGCGCQITWSDQYAGVF